MDQDKISNLYRGSSIDVSYQVSAHLAKWFQRRILPCEKLTDDRRQVMAKAHIAFGKASEKLTTQKQELPMAAMFVNGSGRNEQSI